MKQKVDFAAQSRSLRSLAAPRLSRDFLVPELSDIWSIERTLRQIDSRKSHGTLRGAACLRPAKEVRGAVSVLRGDNTNAFDDLKNGRSKRITSSKKDRRKSSGGSSKKLSKEVVPAVAESILPKEMEESAQLIVEPIPKREYTYNNMYGLFCFQNLLRKKVRFNKEKKEFEAMRKNRTRFKAHEKQKAEESMKSLRMDTLQSILRQKTRNFMTGCIYDSVIKIAMGKVLAVILNKYIQRSFGNHLHYKIVVHTVVVECTGQSVFVGSRCLLEKVVDKVISYHYRFDDAASVVNIYLFK